MNKMKDLTFCLREVRRCFLIIILLKSSLLIAQTAQDYDLVPIELPDVYSNYTVNDIIKDHLGLIWIASNSGLYWYDGVKCHKFGNSGIKPEMSGKIYKLIEDSSDRLWILGENGLVLLDKERVDYIPLTHAGLPKAVVSAQNLALCKGKGEDIFILSDTSIYLWCNNNLKLWSAYHDPVIQTNMRSILLYSEKQNQLFWYLPDQNEPTNRIVLYQKEGKVIKLWKALCNDIDHLNQAVFLFTLVNNTYADSVELYTALQPNKMNRVHFQSDYRLLKVRPVDIELSKGVYLKNIYQDYINKFNPTLHINTIGRVFIFKISDEIFALSSSKGIILVKPKQRFFHFFKNTLDQRIRAIHKDKFGNIIFGTYNGTKYFNPKEGRLRNLGASYSYIWSILKISSTNDSFVMQGEDDTNNLHFLESSSTGIRITHTKNNFGDISKRAFNTCIAEDKTLGGFWHITNENHLCFYDIKTDKNHKFHPVLKNREERAMIATNDGIWLAGHLGLSFFSHFDFNTYTFLDKSCIIPQKLQKLSINALHLDSEQNLWIGTNTEGLYRYQPSNGNIEQYTTQDGLSENTIYSILPEKRQRILWIGTGKGLCRFDIKKSSFNNYYTEDGLSNNEFNTGSAFQADDGMIYMGGQNGINYFHPDSIQITSQAMKSFAVINLKDTELQGANQVLIVAPNSTIVIQSNIKLIEMEFRSDDYFNIVQLQYRYRIPGLVNQWIYQTATDKAIFTKLPHGVYTVEVQARSHRGMWLPTVSYQLDVIPPWHATWWFRIVIGMLSILILYGLYRLRIGYLRREFELRQQISHDLHDSLGSKIYLLRSMSHRISNPLISDTEKTIQLDKIEEISNDAFKTIRDFIWAFDPRQDEIAHLFGRMDDFAENYLSPIIGELNIVNPEVSKRYKVGPRAKHHLMNIYQEALTNMVRHTDSRSITINLGIEQHKIKIQIVNKHNGYKNQDTYAHKGLHAGMNKLQYRLTEIHADLYLHESDAQRQEVIISVDLSKV